MKWTAVVAACAVASLAFGLADDVTPGSGGIGTNFTLSAFGLTPVKPPKVLLVPQAGQTATKTVKAKLLGFSDVRIDCQVVKGVAGVYDVQLVSRDAGVEPITMLDPFTITVPEPASVDPASGPVKIPVAILGSGFGDFKGKVTIGGRNAKVTRWGADRIEVVVPKKLLAGDQPVVVTNRAGVSTTSVTFTVAQSSTGGAERFFRYDENTNHFNVTEEDTFFNTGATFNVSQNFAGFGASGRPNGQPALILAVNTPDLATATPFTVTILPTATGALTVTYSNYSSVYAASIDSNFTLTITGYADGVIEGTFAGDLTKLAGNGPATVTIANGSFRSTMHITGQQ